jgi:hypothetical protein
MDWVPQLVGTLLGVLVGGGLTAFFSNRLADRSEAADHARFLSERRQTVYAELLSLSSRVSIAGHPIQALRNPEEVLKSQDAYMSLTLIAPTDTADAAKRLLRAALANYSVQASEEAIAKLEQEYQDARKEFVDLARRDVRIETKK